jgi:hypothetical protein
MKKLDLKQMEKVNGGDFCSRMQNRYNRMWSRGVSYEDRHKIYQKAVDAGCEY